MNTTPSGEWNSAVAPHLLGPIDEKQAASPGDVAAVCAAAFDGYAAQGINAPA